MLSPTVDFEPPMLLCPGNIVMTVLEGITERVVEWLPPEVSDNSGTVNLVSQSGMSGGTYPVGTTTVSYIYEDASGNVATCSFDIIIITGKEVGTENKNLDFCDLMHLVGRHSVC